MIDILFMLEYCFCFFCFVCTGPSMSPTAREQNKLKIHAAWPRGSIPAAWFFNFFNYYIWYSTLVYTVLYSTVQYCTVLYSTVQYYPGRISIYNQNPKRSGHWGGTAPRSGNRGSVGVPAIPGGLQAAVRWLPSSSWWIPRRRGSLQDDPRSSQDALRRFQDSPRGFQEVTKNSPRRQKTRFWWIFVWLNAPRWTPKTLSGSTLLL